MTKNRFRKILPLVGLAIVLVGGIYAWWQNRTLATLGISRTTDGELLVVVRAPAIRGLNNRGYAYEITARTAERAALDNTTTRLLHIEGFMDGADPQQQWQLRAAQGIYNQAAGTVRLLGDIHLAAEDGTHIEMTALDIDIKTSLATSDQPITMRATNGHITAETLHIAYDERLYNFTQAQLEFQPPPETTTTDLPASTSPLNGGASLKGQFVTDADAPIRVRGDALRFDERARITHLTGAVRAKQGDLYLHAAQMRLVYTPALAPEVLHAQGQVEIKSKNGRTARAAAARYIFAQEVLVMEGAVEVIAEPETEQVERLYGERLTIDMRTGKSHLAGDTTTKNGRARIELNAPVR